MSIAGGMSEAVKRARSVDATALQVFVKSSNQWAARAFAEGEVEGFRAAIRDAGLARHTVAHASYLINLASPDDALWEKSVAALRLELDRCEALAIPWLVVHPGAHMGAGVAAGIKRVASALQRVLPRSKEGSSGVLLENTAGQGTTLGARFEDIGEMMKQAGDLERVGACIDTCHALAAGHEFRSPSAYGEMIAAVDRAFGLGRLRAFHLNDSKGDLGSKRDRHEHIGKGRVGLPGFRSILTDPRFSDLPMVIETEKADDLAEDRVNLQALRSVAAR